MKFVLTILLVIPALGSALPDCGNDQSSGTAAVKTVKSVPRGPEKSFSIIKFRAGGAQPVLLPSHRPPPRKILTRDVSRGTGRVARHGDRVLVYYTSVKYKTGKRVFSRWPPEKPFSFRIGNVPWEKPLVGMREGGWREVIVPSHLLFEAGTVDYLWKMVRVNG